MKEIKTIIDENVQKDLSKFILIAAWICIVIGGISAILYIFSEEIFRMSGASGWTNLLLIGVLPLGIGIGLIIVVNKNIKNVKKVVNENIYDFQDDFVMVKTLRNGEEVSNSKFYYKDFTKSKENQKFFYIYITATSAMPISKVGLSEEELIIIRNYLGLKLKPKK